MFDAPPGLDDVEAAAFTLPFHLGYLALRRVPEAGWEPYVPRYSFSLPLLNAGPTVAFIVGGEQKRDVLARVLAGDDSLPAARVHAPETVVLADEASAAGLR